ncbi:hypothetical protein [Pedobacter sp.]
MTEDKILWTARYAEGDLSEEETLQYEDLLRHDQELKEHLLDYHDAHGSLRMFMAYDNERNALVAGIKELNDKYFISEAETEPAPVEVKKIKTVKLSGYLRWVSGVAAVLVVGLLVWSPWKADLYEQYYGTPSMSVTERGTSKTDLDEAAALFNAKKYNEAKFLLAKLHASNSSNAIITYYFAISLLETDEVAKSRLLLEDLFQGESVYKNDAAYVMAMSYLKEGKESDAKFWLEKVANGTVQYEKAQELLKKL